ncbi:hypothetical protein [Actinomadura sp. 3N508]|uniref:hypothetical protein n=1 Tax=Actinomadura sp. 3N508 TaxID=3375153 RepID=UPI0037A25B42
MRDQELIPFRCEVCGAPDRWRLARDRETGAIVTVCGCGEMFEDTDAIDAAHCAGREWAEDLARDVSAALARRGHSQREFTTALSWFAERVHGGRRSVDADEHLRNWFGLTDDYLSLPGHEGA